MSETPLTPEQIVENEARAAKEGYVKRVLISLDQFANVITGGKPGETVSARSGRAAARGAKFGKFMVWWLDKFQKNHGEKAEAGDLARAKSVEDAETKA